MWSKLKTSRLSEINPLIYIVVFAIVGGYIIFRSLAATNVTCNLYASTTGSDTNAGTIASPFRSAQKLFDSLSPGQTGCLRGGTYIESELRANHSGTSGSPITLTSYPGERATIETNTDFYIPDPIQYVTISNLNLTNNLSSGTVAASMIQDFGENTIWQTDDISGNTHSTCMELGSVGYGTAHNTLIKDNKIHDCGNTADGNQDHAIYMAVVANATITENVFWNTGAYAIHMYPESDGAQVTHNVFDNSGYGGVIFASDQYQTSNVSDNNTVAYNIFSNGQHYGMDYYWGPAGVGQGNVAHDNCMYNNATGDFDGSMQNITLTNNPDLNPQYNNAAGHDYTLQSGSPCLSVVQYDAAAAVNAAFSGTANSTNTDTTAPTVSITAPASGSTVSGTASVSASASDNVGVTKVELYVDGSLKATDTASPYNFSWDTTTATNGSHTLTAKAYDAAGNIGSSSSVSVTVSNVVASLPSVPTGLTATPGNLQVTLNWNANPTTDKIINYNVYRTDQTFTGPWASPTTTTFTNASNLVNGTQYCYTITAVNAAGESAKTSPVCTTPTSGDTTPPTVNITSPASGSTVSGNVTIMASAADNVAVAHVDFFVDGNLLSTLTASPYSVTWNAGATTNGSHTITVTAYDTSNNSTTSSEAVTVSNPDTTPPSAPTNLTASASSATQVNLSWGASTDNVGVAGYYVERNGVVISKVNASATTYTDTGLTASTTYSYNIVAFDAAGNASQPSNTASVTTPAPSDTTPPSVPTNLTTSATSATQVNLAWSASTDTGGSGLAGYRIYRNGSLLATVSATTTSFGDATVSGNTTYTYTVSAFDGAGNASAQSQPSTITTPVPVQPPSNLTFNPTDDAYVSSRKPTTNYGSSSQLQVDASPTQNTYAKFTVSGVGTKTVVSAKLRLYVANGSVSGGSLYRLTNNTWSESTITYNNQPSADTTSLASLSRVNSGSWVEIDLTGLISGDGTYGVKIVTNSTNSAVYDSKETANKPVLILGVQ